MKGARPLTNDEILHVAKQFQGEFAVRNRSLFMLGVSVGGRISEMLALTIGDVWQNGKPVSDLLFARGMVKGKETSRMVPINPDGEAAILELIAWHAHRYGDLASNCPLFPSRFVGKKLSRVGAHKALAKAFTRAGLNGKLATHSLRKSFAQRVYDRMGDIFAVKELLGHRSVETTREYLGTSYQKLQQAVDEISTQQRHGEISQGNKMGVLFPSADNLPDEAILIQALKRGLISPQAVKQQPTQGRIQSDDKRIPIDHARRHRRR